MPDNEKTDTPAGLDANRTVVVATNNEGKLREIRAIVGSILDGYDFIPIGELGDYPDPEETGMTFYENALIKADAALDATGLRMAIADDSGLCVRALGGLPGVFSARWAGAHGDDARNNGKLLDAMKDVPNGERQAHFHTTVVMVVREDDGTSTAIIGDGDCWGSIAWEPRGEDGFGYDPLFVLDDGTGRRMAELTADEKNAMSHRRKALEVLAKNLS